MTAQAFPGVWRSHYSYPSSSRQGEFEGEHYVRFHEKGNQLVVESIPNINKSYLVVRLSLDGNIATGSWQEETDPNGYYQGAIYYGAIQLVVSNDAKHMQGRWVGFSKDMEVNVGTWEFAYVGQEVPADASTV